MKNNLIFPKGISTKTAIYALSGILSGIAFYLAIQSSADEAMATFGGMWFPGLIFGILFAISNRWSNSRMVSFSVVSALAYYCAFRIARDYYLHVTVGGLVVAGLLAGGFGAFALFYVLTLLSNIKVTLKESMLTIVIGAFTGALFLKILFFKPDEFATSVLQSCLAFALWQASVGVKIQYLYQREAETNDQVGEIDKRIKGFLEGPIVQAVGLIASVLGILSYFSK